MPERYVFHIDVNSAFLSWSASHRVNILGDSRDLRQIPSIVGGNQENRHGIVLAKSIPAKRYGITTGEPVASALQKCPDLAIVPPDYDLYVRASRSLIHKLQQYSDRVIQYSIDEAWMVFEGFESLYGRGQMVKFAHDLKEEIKQELGFTVNVGVSTNFLLSKMAGDFKKPDLVHTLFPEEIKQKMWPLPVSELFFIGKATEKKLYTLGIRTIGELAHAEDGLLKAHLKRPGLILKEYANGLDLQPFLYRHEANKGYGNSLTAPRDVTCVSFARHLLLSLCETVGARLRADHVMAGTLSVHITTFEFAHSSKQMQLFTPTDITEELFENACLVFDKLWDGHTPIRQIGVHTSQISRDTHRQYRLFQGDHYDKSAAFDRTVDFIRNKYGEDSIFRASFLQSDISHMSGGLAKNHRTGVTLGVHTDTQSPSE